LRRNFNEMLANVGRGEYLATHAHDDLCLPHRLEASVDALESQPGAAMVYSDADLIDEAGNLTGQRFSALWREGEGEADFVRRLFFHGNFVCATTVMIRGSAIAEAALRVPRPIELCIDYYCWLILAARGAVARLPEPVSRYRVSADQMSTRSRETQREDFFIPRMTYRISPELRRQIPAPEARALFVSKARLYLHRRQLDGDVTDATRYGLRLLALEPSARNLIAVARAVRGAQLARRRFAA
jgi:hypothetical protein